MLFRLLLSFSALVLLVNSLYLISLKRWHIGTFLPFIVGLFFLAIVLFYPKIQLLLQQSIQWKRIWITAWICFGGWVVSVLCFFTYLHHLQSSQQRQLPQQPVAMIVLGSQIINGQPSPALKNRLDTALKYQKLQPHLKIIVTGGIGTGETLSEAEVMSNYLQQHGVLAHNIILENQSTSTELNLQNSVPLLQQHHIDIQQPIVLVTNDFHTLRAKKIAQKIGYTHIYSLAAPTPLLTRYNSWLREYFAFISGWLLREY